MNTFNVTGLMKNFVEHFMCKPNRPSFFGKKAVVATTASSSRIASLLATLAMMACAQPPEVPPGIELTGMYRYMADAAVFEDCATGVQYPVLIEAEHIEVERAYLALGEAPGAPVLLTARFEVVERPPEPGMAPRQHLRVVEFGTLRPGEVCPP